MYDEMLENTGALPDGMTMSMLESDTQIKKRVKNAVKKDPFLKYGAGIKTYFSL